ncbi:MAG TPA: CHAT domain-containing protein [Thermoanaerobaculia bacterium]|nr:CHAT domain-containing protein [Thermoanaerobaculia bacterium]
MMSEEAQIRLVSVEFLRPGPPHNQLLSPLTQYLAVCGDAGAGVVTVPYEHGRFERLLKELRYEGDPEDRQALLHDLGTDMGKLLGGVPGLPGALTNDLSRPGTLVHLRLTLSASELALLPFELAKVPVTASVSGQSWLALQTRPPVCVTRNIRTVSPEGVLWPERPRILFIAGDPENVPYKDHRGVLKQAIRRFRYPDRDDKKSDSERGREQYGDLLTILIHPTLADVFQECQDHRYTHIHILTHGDETSPGVYGLVLRGPDGAPDVVSGDRFRAAITTVGHRPSVVTVASCDSANVGSVVIPGASFAHELHQAGIPLVIAAQFPLSIEGSIPLTARLYDGLLWGEHPLVLLQKARAELHARYTANWHDWASLVVYEALPHVLADQLDALKYFQTKRAMNSALERIDNAIKPDNQVVISLKDLDQAVEYALERLPLKGQYGVECVGLRASSRKRVAQAAFTLPEGPDTPLRDPYDLLEEARLDYDRAVRGLMVNDSRILQRLATLHWVLVQVASLSMVLGKNCDEGSWEAAKLSADRYRDHSDPEQRAWAHASLAELWLIRLGETSLDEAAREKLHQHAVHHAEELGRFYPGDDEFPVKSTRRQFERYVHWWGHPDFEKALETRGAKRLAPWSDKFGVIETAKHLVELLRRRPAGGNRKPSGGGGTPQSGPSGPSGAPSGSASGAGGSSARSAQPKSLSKEAAPPEAPRRREGAFFDIEVLPAGHGDSLWIEYGDAAKTHRWLIDCGTQQTARHLLRRVDAVPVSERFLELFVMSHIDSDHIGGALPFFKAVTQGLRFGDVWFNGWRQLSGKLGARQGEMFSTALQDLELPWNVWREGGPIVVADGDLPVHVLPGGMKLTLLSPTPDRLKKLAPVWTREMKRYGLEPGSRVDYRKFLRGTPSTSTNVDELADEAFGDDNGAPNGTSIAVLAEYGGASALLAADSHAPVLVQSIKALLAQRGGDRLKVDVFKVSHHGSQNNVSTELVKLLDCSRYIVSTNGDHFCHPDRQAVARLIKYGRRDGNRPALYFNYKSGYNEVWERPDLQEKYGYSALYPPADQPGTLVSLLAGRV